MSLSSWDEGSDSDRLRGVNRVGWLVGHCKILAWQWAKLPCYGREGAVEVRPFPAERRSWASEAQGLSGEAVKGNPRTTAILRVDESKSGLQNKPKTRQNLGFSSGSIFGRSKVSFSCCLSLLISRSPIVVSIPARSSRQLF